MHLCRNKECMDREKKAINSLPSEMGSKQGICLLYTKKGPFETTTTTNWQLISLHIAYRSK